MPKSNKQITFEDLAIMIKKGFDGTEEKIKESDKNFKNFTIEVINRFDFFDKKFDLVEKRLNKIDLEIKHLQLALKIIRKDIIKLEKGQKKLEKGQEILEKGQELILAKLDKMVYKEEFDQLAKRVKILEQTVGIA